MLAASAIASTVLGESRRECMSLLLNNRIDL